MDIYYDNIPGCLWNICAEIRYSKYAGKIKTIEKYVTCKNNNIFIFEGRITLKSKFHSVIVIDSKIAIDIKTGVVVFERTVEECIMSILKKILE